MQLPHVCVHACVRACSLQLLLSSPISPTPAYCPEPAFTGIRYGDCKEPWDSLTQQPVLWLPHMLREHFSPWPHHRLNPYFPVKLHLNELCEIFCLFFSTSTNFFVAYFVLWCLGSALGITIYLAKLMTKCLVAVCYT